MTTALHGIYLRRTGRSCEVERWSDGIKVSDGAIPESEARAVTLAMAQSRKVPAYEFDRAGNPQPISP